MDVLYVVGTGSKCDNAELRYSLRSLEKFGKNLGRVIIVGHCPEWINRNHVHHIPAIDETSVPSVNVFRKIRKAIEDHAAWSDARTRDRGFLLMADDIFFTRPVDLEKYPIYSKGLMPTLQMTRETHYGDRRYTELLLNTAAVMEQHGLGNTMYSHHAPLHYSITAYDYLQERGITSMLNAAPGLSMANLMVSAHVKLTGCPTSPRQDVKLGDRELLAHPVDWWVRQSDCFSIYDAAFKYGMMGYLETSYPLKSRFEK